MTSDGERVVNKGINLSIWADATETVDDSAGQYSPSLKYGNGPLTNHVHKTLKSSVASFLTPLKNVGESDQEEAMEGRNEEQLNPGATRENDLWTNGGYNRTVDQQSETRSSGDDMDTNENGATADARSAAGNSSNGDIRADDEGSSSRVDAPDFDHDDISSRVDLPNANSIGPTGRANLEEASLDAIVAFIKSKEYIRSYLDEDEIVAFTHATHRHAENRTKYRKNLATMGSDHQNAHDRIYQEEEYFSLADAFFRDLIDGASEKAGFDVENRTVTWLKRAAGLQKPNDPLEKSMGYYSDSQEEQVGDGRRRTRRAKKGKRNDSLEKEHEGLSLFVDAIKQIEEERGEKKVSNIPSYPDLEVSEDSFTADEHMSDSHDNLNSMRVPIHIQEVREYPPGSKLFAHMSSGLSDLVGIRIICDGKVMSNADKKDLHKWHVSRKRAREKIQEQKIQERAKKHLRSSDDSFRSFQSSSWKTVCVGDRIRAWLKEYRCYFPARVMERNGKSAFLYYDDGKSEWVDLGDGNFQIMEPVDVDYDDTIYEMPSPSKGQLEYGLPDLDDSIFAFPSTAASKTEEILKPISQAGLCKKVYHLLGGQATKWARYEFFYPEFDAAWYQFDTNAAAIASIVPPGTMPTWKQWRAIRRKLGSPRRFSKSFIADELYKRNEYRRTVRMLQRSPGSTKGQGFPVPRLIEPGTAVTAYNKRYQIIQRGKILFYSPGDNGYFVQFDSVDLGSEFCPDTEVTRVKPPQPVQTRLQTNSKASKMAFLDEVKNMDENDLVFERYSLVSLMSTLERLLERKRGILDAMEENNRSDFARLESQFRNPSKCDPYRSANVQLSISAWLHANLILTNDALREANRILKAIYSEDSPFVVHAPSSNGPVQSQRGDVIELTRRKQLTERILQSMGYDGRSLQLQQCTEALLEMEMRKVLWNPPRKY